MSGQGLRRPSESPCGSADPSAERAPSDGTYSALLRVLSIRSRPTRPRSAGCVLDPAVDTRRQGPPAAERRGRLPDL